MFLSYFRPHLSSERETFQISMVSLQKQAELIFFAQRQNLGIKRKCNSVCKENLPQLLPPYIPSYFFNCHAAYYYMVNAKNTLPLHCTVLGSFFGFHTWIFLQRFFKAWCRCNQCCVFIYGCYNLINDFFGESKLCNQLLCISPYN